MKIIKLMNGVDIEISKEDSDKIEEIIENAKFIKLPNGDFINVSSVSCIVDYKGLAVWNGHNVYESQNGEKYIRVKPLYGNGEIIKRYLTTGDEIEIEYRTEEDYENFIKRGKEKLRIETEQKNKRQREFDEAEKREKEEIEKEKKRWDALSEKEKNMELLNKKEIELKMFEDGVKKNPEWSYYKKSIIKIKKEIGDLKNKL